MILSVQCAVGEVGSKPVTMLKYPAGPFHGLINTSGNQYGINDGGAWQLNYMPDDGTPTDDGQSVKCSVRLNASDFGYPENLKKIDYIYAAMTSTANCKTSPSITALPDEQPEMFFSKMLLSQKKIRVPVKDGRQGGYWTIGFDIEVSFTLFNMSTNFTVRPMGVSNGCR